MISRPRHSLILALAALLAGCQHPTGGGTAPTPEPRWKQATASAPFGAINYHTSLVFAPSGQTEPLLWVIGGIKNNTNQDKVWSSADGTTWTEAVKTDAGKRFSARSKHTSVVFDGKMWVLGGYADTLKNDVWSSADGKDWTKVTDAAGWTYRETHSSLVFGGKMWVLGGSGYTNDVWSSGNGKDWKLESWATWSGRMSHSSLTFTDPTDNLNKMWVLGGDPRGNDVWWSTNGQSWTQARAADWSPRYSHSSVVFKEKMWVIGGVGGGSDVWYYPDSPAIVPAPSPAPPAPVADPPVANQTANTN